MEERTAKEEKDSAMSTETVRVVFWVTSTKYSSTAVKVNVCVWSQFTDVNVSESVLSEASVASALVTANTTSVS